MKKQKKQSGRRCGMADCPNTGRHGAGGRLILCCFHQKKIMGRSCSCPEPKERQ